MTRGMTRRTAGALAALALSVALGACGKYGPPQPYPPPPLESEQESEEEESS